MKRVVDCHLAREGIERDISQFLAERGWESMVFESIWFWQKDLGNGMIALCDKSAALCLEERLEKKNES